MVKDIVPEKKQKTSYDWKTKLLFNVVILCIPFVLIGLIEGSLRLANRGTDLTLFVDSGNYPGFLEINRKVNLRYFSKLEETSPTNDIFLKEKADSCYRIFVFGGSTTRGFPYQASTAFPRILYFRLQDAFPNKRIEVVNLSASAISTYTYTDMLDEVLDQDPDLILVYGGHNEYYGSLGVGSIEGGGNKRWIKKLRLKLVHLRSFQLLQKTIVDIGKNINSSKDSNATLMQRIVDDKDIAYGSKTFEKGVAQFDNNMRELVKKASAKHVPVILSELVSNVEDQKPFKSVKSQNQESAIDVYNSAALLVEKGKYDEAKPMFYKARDLDVIRFRAPEEFNGILHEIGDEYCLPVVPMKKVFENASPHGLIGHELMLEHLHPTIDGYFLMADAFFMKLKEEQLIAADWPNTLSNSTYYRDNWGFSELDSLIGDLNIKSLKSGWPFVWDAEPNAFLKSYRYKTLVDSMAFTYLIKKERHIEDEHIKLATYYKENGKYDLAFEEYFSMIKLHPYIPFIYNEAANCLIRLGRFHEALQLLVKAPIMQKDYEYYYLRGTLQLKLGDTNRSVLDLERSYKTRTSDAKPLRILYPLYSAYNQQGDSVNVNRITNEIRRYNKSFKETESSIQLKKEKFEKVDQLLEMAERELELNHLDAALNYVLSADSLSRSLLSEKLKVTIYFKQKEYALAHQAGKIVFARKPMDGENLNYLFFSSIKLDDMKTASLMLKEMKKVGIVEEDYNRLRELYESKKNELTN